MRKNTSWPFHRAKVAGSPTRSVCGGAGGRLASCVEIGDGTLRAETVGVHRVVQDNDRENPAATSDEQSCATLSETARRGHSAAPGAATALIDIGRRLT